MMKKFEFLKKKFLINSNILFINIIFNLKKKLKIFSYLYLYQFLNLADVGFTTRTLKPYDIPKIVVDFSEDEFKEFGNVFDLHRKINKQTQTIMKNKMLGKMTSIEKKVLDGENAGMGTLARKLAKEFQKRQKLEEQKKKNKLKTESIFSDQKKTGKEEDENYQDYEE